MTHVPDGPAGDEVRRLPAPTRREVLAGLEAELAAGGLDSPRVEAERLVAHAMGLERSDLLLSPAEPVAPADAGRIASLMRRRLSGVPLQHIEGTVDFRELVLVCDDRALVPRPETEQLVQLVLDWAFESRGPGVRRVRRIDRRAAAPLGRVLDIGTGGGAIALSLLHEGVARRAVGVDVSPEALEQASENAGRLGLSHRLELRRALDSPWEAIESGESFSAVVSNPPYVADAELAELQVEVRGHDPHAALAGGPDGLDVLRDIAAGARACLDPGGAVFLETGEGQGEAVKGLLEEAGPWDRIEIRRDLAGRERFVVGYS